MLALLLVFTLLSTEILTAPSNPCQSCAKSSTSTTAGARRFASDIVDTTSGACATRTLNCVGKAVSIKINNGARTIADGDDGSVDGRASVVLTCSGAKAWMLDGVAVEKVECA